MTNRKQEDKKTKIYIGIYLAVIITAIVLISGCAQQPQQNQTKTVSVPTEIKSQSEASTLENDTSSILKEVGDSLNNIDASLPEV